MTAMSSSTSVRCYNRELVYLHNGEELQLEQVRAMLPQYKPTTLETFEGVSTIEDTVVHYQKQLVYPASTRGELQLEQVRAKLERYQISCDMEMTEISVTSVVPLSSCAFSRLARIKDVGSDETSVFRTKVSLSNNFKPRLLPTTMSMCDKDKENRSGLCKGYEFTPDSVEGDPSLPGGGSRNGVTTRLNFTDTESMLSASSQSVAHVHNEESLHYKQHASQRTRFHVSSDLEKELGEFAVTGTIIQPSVRRPLQPLTLHKSSFHDVSNANPSQSSFSVYEDTCDESSFLPYHDSMHTSNSFRNPPPLCGSQQHLDTYQAPLEVPLQCISEPDQTFTQFDIAHPKEFGSVSTPKTVHREQNCSFDVSIIPFGDKSSGLHAPVICRGPAPDKHLTPIKEEASGSSKLTSSSRFTVSSSTNSSSGSHSVSGTSDRHLLQCNPFLPDIVNRMLNCLGGVPHGAVQSMTDPIPPISPGNKLLLNGQTFDLGSLLVRGKFSDLYLMQSSVSNQVFRVFNNVPLEWEVTILNHLQHRLEQYNLQHMSKKFQQYHQIYQFPTSFIALSTYHSYGSVQNVIDKYHAMEKVVPDSLVYCFGMEMVSVVSCLHDCGILHAALKPAHFLINSIEKSLCGGPGLQLIDFQHSVDVRQFPEDQVFIGVPPQFTSNHALMEEQPWKWQVDYYGLALCLLSLISRNPGTVKNKQSGFYTWAQKPYKRYNTVKWQEMIEKLLNTSDLALSLLIDAYHIKEQEKVICSHAWDELNSIIR